MRIEYELMHDSLVSPILQWLGEEFWIAQQVREILRVAMPEWRDRQRLLALDDLRLVHEHRHLVNLAADELALIYATAVVFDEEVADWQAQLRPAARLAVLRQLLKHNEPLARQQAAHLVQEFASRAVANRLATLALQDDDEDVRCTAAQSLAAIAQQDVTVARVALAKLTQRVDQPALTERATAALVQVRDQAPIVHAQLPNSLRRSIRWQVWAKRWQRNRATILANVLRALQAGFLGLGVGMGPLLALRGESIREPKMLTALIFVGVALFGFIGSLVMGSAALVNVTQRSLQDREQPWRTWLVTTLVGGATMAPPFIILSWFQPGEGDPGHPAAVGLLIGAVLVGTATLPWLSPPLRVLASASGGMVVFALCLYLRWLIAAGDWGSVILVGGAAGYGFAMGFVRSSPTVVIVDH